MKEIVKYQKTKELILYVANQLNSKANYGATLLNKCLYFIDNVSYLKTGKVITDFTYVKQSFGPTPEPSLLLSIKDDLVNSDDLEIKEVEFFGRIQKRWVAKRQPKLEMFSGDEIALVDEIISHIEDLNGSQISEFSHQFPAWQAASDREELPFYTFLLSAKAPSLKDIEWAKAEMR